ncbi:MAG: hypothetical protein ABIO17_13600, partial [Pseudoxanthomonas sp.]
QNLARKAWNEREQGLEKATKEGKQQEYLGEAQGAAGVEIIATFLPATQALAKCPGMQWFQFAREKRGSTGSPPTGCYGSAVGSRLFRGSLKIQGPIKNPAWAGFK